MSWSLSAAGVVFVLMLRKLYSVRLGAIPLYGCEGVVSRISQLSASSMCKSEKSQGGSGRGSSSALRTQAERREPRYACLDGEGRDRCLRHGRMLAIYMADNQLVMHAVPLHRFSKHPQEQDSSV